LSIFPQVLQIIRRQREYESIKNSIDKEPLCNGTTNERHGHRNDVL
jgi:hypothetical protein